MNKIKNILITLYIINFPLSFYILGRETSIKRNKSDDFKLYLKYTVGMIFYTPYYIYQNKIPKFGEDKRWK